MIMIAHLLQIDGLSKIIDNLSIVTSIAFRFCAHGCGQFLSCSLKTSVYRLDQHTIIVYLIGLELMKGSNLGLVDVPKNARPLELVAESEPAPGGSWQAAFIDDGKNTIASQLVERLREAIVSGQLEAGAKINLLRAREIFSVSLSPLREALARLIPDGLVTFEDNRGYRVAPVSVSNLREITRLRQEFETLALRQAIASAPPEWEGDVMRALHRLNTAERNAADPATLEHWEALHRDFHLSLLSGCGMPLLLGFCRTLLNLNDRYRRSFLVSTSGDRNVGMEHSEIAQGAAARDAEFACARLREHIHRTGSNLASHLADRIAP